MRFDDSLKTVLAADASTDFGARAAFRQIVDLMARGRIPASDDMLDRLRALRAKVPVDTRAAVARSMAIAMPPAALVIAFAEDEPVVVQAVLRAVRLADDDWVALLPRLGPAGRAVLRRRSDLGAAALRALESFGSTDFALSYDAPSDEAAAPVAVADAPPAPRSEIAELVERIAAYQRRRDDAAPASLPETPAAEASAGAFRFATDADGVIRWIDAQPRGAVIGISFARTDADDFAQVDGVAAGAFRRRTAFNDARLSVGGGSALAGDWRMSGVPAFDRATGRFTGFHGRARRPRVDEDAAVSARSGAASEGLRRLVHELRTPTNAIAGFSELIERELLGPVPALYRARAAEIRGQAADLTLAIEDLELAARIEGDALELRASAVALAPLLARVAADLAPLAALRGSGIAVVEMAGDTMLACDDRIVERLLGRLLAALVSVSAAGETVAVAAAQDGAAMARIDFSRPDALAAVPEAALLSLDAEREAELPGAPLLGTGFALRLARNLARELGGALTIGPTGLTLTLPAAFVGDMGQASTI